MGHRTFVWVDSPQIIIKFNLFDAFSKVSYLYLLTPKWLLFFTLYFRLRKRLAISLSYTKVWKAIFQSTLSGRFFKI